jgi:hypothetical protein
MRFRISGNTPTPTSPPKHPSADKYQCKHTEPESDILLICTATAARRSTNLQPSPGLALYVSISVVFHAKYDHYCKVYPAVKKTVKQNSSGAF